MYGFFAPEAVCAQGVLSRLSMLLPETLSYYILRVLPSEWIILGR